MIDAPTNTFHVELNDYRGPLYLRACGLHMRRIVKPGSIIRTNYATGPYVVVRVTPDWFLHGNRQWLSWSFACDHASRDAPNRPGRAAQRWPQACAYLNEFVVVGGRVVHLFANNDDEVFVEGFDAHAARLLQPKPEQGLLF